MKKLLIVVMVIACGLFASFVVIANVAPDGTWNAIQYGRQAWHAVVTKVVLASYTRPKIDTKPRYATRNGNLVTVYPGGVTFRVPDFWLTWDKEFHNNFYLTREQLSGVEHGAGEWDTEYGKVVNAAFPFNDCAAHVGGEGWGKEGASSGDIQLRVYVTSMSPRQVMYRMAGPGLAMARQVSPDPDSAEFVDEGTEGRWRKAELTYSLWYYDYGGRARIRAYTTNANERTLALIFMGGPADEIKSIIDSVSTGRAVAGLNRNERKIAISLITGCE